MKRLEHVAINGTFADETVLLHLTSVPTLTSMFLETAESGTSTFIDTADIHLFPRLRRFILSNGDHAPDNFLSAINPAPALEALSIPWIYQYSPDNTAGVVDRILGTLERSNLSSLGIHLTTRLAQLITERNILFDLRLLPRAQECLQPLLRLSQLRVVKLELAVAFLVDNAFLRELALALPRMELLSLIPFCNGRLVGLTEGESAPLPTVDGLLPLVEHCRHLADIALAICPLVSPDFNLDMRRMSQQASLRKMRLWATPIDDDSWAQNLSQFFPSAFPGLEQATVGIFVLTDQEQKKLRSQGAVLTRRWESALGGFRPSINPAVHFVDALAFREVLLVCISCWLTSPLQALYP